MSGSVSTDWVLEAGIAKNRLFLFALTLGLVQLIPCIERIHFPQAGVWTPFFNKDTKICVQISPHI